ncbi:hypothetical protein LZK48_28775, partial [Pseudomonas aeruginosa]|nr:hypothetical protein [Pseudomonas aeruginosa]
IQRRVTTCGGRRKTQPTVRDGLTTTLGTRELQLSKLLELADLRNRSSHAQSSFTGREKTQLTSRMALDSIQYALSFTACFKEWM